MVGSISNQKSLVGFWLPLFFIFFTFFEDRDVTPRTPRYQDMGEQLFNYLISLWRAYLVHREPWEYFRFFLFFLSKILVVDIFDIHARCSRRIFISHEKK